MIYSGSLVQVQLPMYGSLVDVSALLPLLHLSAREAKRLSHISTTMRLTPAQLDTWLKGLQVPSALRDIGRHLQAHLPLMVRSSVSVQAEEAKHRQQLEEEKAAVIEVHQPLESVDHFRADASIGPHRMEPEVISRTVETGVLDLFVREDNPFAEDNSAFRQLEIPLQADFRRNLLHDFRAHGEVLTGPEFQKAYPTHPLLKRRTLPAIPFMQVDEKGNQKLILLPERQTMFRWETDKENP